MNTTNDYVNMNYLDQTAIAVRAPKYDGAFITRTEVSTQFQCKCIECSVLGVCLLALGILDLTVSVSKGNFWHQTNPALNASFVNEIADYVVFGSGILSFMASALAFRSATVSENQIFTKILVITSIGTSVLGLSVSDYFSK